MANRRKEIPSFVSIEVGVARSIAEAMTDDEWGKWSKKALDDLSIGCTRKDTDARVRNLYAKAKDNMDNEYLRKKEWYENRKAKGNNPQDAPNGNAGVDRKSATSCDTFTADGDTREDSQEKHNGSAITINETRSYSLDSSAKLYGDAPHREAGDESATVSKNVSTPAMSTNRRRTGGPSLSQTSSLTPVRQSEPDVMSLAYSGEFCNVRLTNEQYAELGIKFGNQQKLNRAIDSLSCKIENGETNPRNHYAELVKWAAYRDDMEEAEEVKAAKLPHYETVSEHNARIVQESDAWIHEYCQQQKKNRKSANG